MPEFATPGVYIKELNLLPPSVAEVSTAIPAFVGYTEKGPSLEPSRITSMLEYEEIFGGPQVTTINADGDIVLGSSIFHLFYQLEMFFRNGGGACYVTSVGGYNVAPQDSVLIDGINKLKSEDEPTLLVVPEATNGIYNEILQHCKDRKDRFAILDVDMDRVQSLRAAVTAALDYGAVYTPYLITNLSIQDKHVAEEGVTLDQIKGNNTKRYWEIKALLAKHPIVLPPSGAIAGLYARIDRERGVWKAPANTGLIGVVAPTVKISDDDQALLNSDATSGKSINAIRSFPGKGTLVWGARTLDGNSNEWRYINVRRLFIMIEESIQKATQFAVFEPNTASTWLKVKAMIESYLYGLWQRGALAGSKPEHAYFVRVGLNVTMTQQDILEGIMRVSVGIAAVRPAEFIQISFSHKLQES